MRFYISPEKRRHLEDCLFQLQPENKFMVKFDKDKLEFIPKEVEVYTSQEQCRKACMLKMKMLAIYLGAED